ncbi:cell division protein FtsA [Candidatus Kaiserbacteria bacterium RIFCSPHIGHO2_01_FULL_55_17]|uniref:Cell division protein FtsA n=1 Tax=Candidatus Kaiserbacteria bacterium RIFCSPHIGHO2_01_FULL_55_17 TaxID=1798484 RepID=A0A1F6D9L7_9BACT|nr:MAG: cell division protein FtsA [Candidatus Kaiserbacteria bacterium RIFCSPHIGHO2_01_FULL_55_17]
MRKIYAGIDIGTSQTKVVIAAPGESPELPMQILGTGTANSKGMRHGYVVDPREATRGIREALHRAASQAKVRVRRARVALGGIGLEEVRSTGEVSLTPSGGIVTDREVDRSLRESEKRASSKLVNRSIIHTIPLEYRVDGSRVFGKPQGLQGTKLSVDALLITLLTQHHDDLVEAVESAGVEVDGIMAAPLAASLVTLTKAQKTAGVVLTNIGGETLSIVVFENDAPISIKVFSTGSSDITNTIALSLRIPLAEAEQMKRGAVTGSDVPPRRMQAIVAKRTRDMFTLVNTHLKDIGRSRLLPAGVVITGGGSGLAGVSEVARAVLQLPAQVSQVSNLPRSAGVDATWAVAYGLCRWAYAEEMSGGGSTLGEIAENVWDTIKQTFRSLLP